MKHILIFSLLTSLALAPCSADQRVGFSDTKPAEGPYVETEQGFMVPYQATIPGTEVMFKMTPVPGGVVTLGLREPSGDEEAGEVSPTVQVEVPPRWVGVNEVSWAEYWEFMRLQKVFTRLSHLRSQLYDGAPKLEAELKELPELQAAVDAFPSHVDGVTAPTPLYDPSTTYLSGEEPDLPAVSMTVYAAKQYTKWLSTITGNDYRLPSEAEWEHAARAGAEGDTIAGKLDANAWYTENSDYETHTLGEKIPNAWGLYDAIGNAAEWVLDAPSDMPTEADAPLAWREAIAEPKSESPRVAKGGHYDAEAEDCRFASRLISVDEDWKASDPNIPLSPWWFTDDPASGVGIRLVRPFEPMDEATRKLAWEIDSPDLQKNVDQRLREGRAKLQNITKDLPKVVKQLDSDKLRKLTE